MDVATVAVLDVVDVAVSGSGVTAFALAVAVAGDDGPSLRRRPHPSLASDVEYLGFGSEDDAGEGAVTGDHPQQVDVDDGAVFGFVEATGDSLEGGRVCVEADVGFLASGL